MKKIINGIKNIDKIAEGIYNYNHINEEIEQKAKERAKICVNCPFIVDEKDFEPIPFFRLNLKDRIKEISNKVCSDCGCNLNYKLRTKQINKSKNCIL